MDTMHLFAGVGGGLLADLILGHRPIVAVEWDKYACQVLRERSKDGWFPNLSVWEGDVRLFDPSEYAGRVDCIHAGFPCQDISVAGKQAGVSEGTRSGLYREVLRIAGVVRPEFLFLENVSAITSNGLGTVLADLASMGYDSRWLCIRASDVGAPHHRDRWFALCHAKHDGQVAAKIAGSIASGSNGNKAGQKSAKQFTRPSYTKILADAECVRQSRQGKHEQSIGSEAHQNWKTDRAFDVCPEHIGWWDVESNVGRVAYELANTMDRLTCIGNGIVPLQAATAWRLLGGE